MRAVEARLRAKYGQPRHGNKRDPLSEVVYIILSRRTPEKRYAGTFRALWTAYRSWERVRLAPDSDLVELIRVGGFAEQKVGHIKALLNQVHSDRGRTSLRWLRNVESDDEVLASLQSLPGVGLKTAKCVMAYSLDKPVLAVDIHVWRIAKRLGWAEGGKFPTDRQSTDLETLVPAHLRYSLHVTMVAHGRNACRGTPRCDSCLLRDLCPQFPD